MRSFAIAVIKTTLFEGLAAGPSKIIGIEKKYGCWLELVELLLAYHVVDSDPKRIDVSSMVLNHDSS